MCHGQDIPYFLCATAFAKWLLTYQDIGVIISVEKGATDRRLARKIYNVYSRLTLQVGAAIFYDLVCRMYIRLRNK